MLLDRRDDLKLADFSGSSITDMPDCPALVTYDTRSRLPNIDEPNRASDLFALGSAIYEMATGDLPYPSLPAREVQRLFFQREFPNLDRPGICPAIAQVIRRCWLVDTPAGFKSTKEVARELRCYYSGKTNREPRVAETTPTAAKSKRTHSRKIEGSFDTSGHSHSSRNRKSAGKSRRHSEDFGRRADEYRSKTGHHSKRRSREKPMS